MSPLSSLPVQGWVRAVGRPYTPGTALVAVNRWGLTDAQRAQLREIMLRDATAGLTPEHRATAARVLLAMDALDARRDRDAQDADLGATQLALQAYQARLAADPAYADAVAALPIPSPQLDAPPASDSGDYVAPVAPPCPLGHCDGGGYVVTDAGAVPCDCARPAPGAGTGGRCRTVGGRSGNLHERGERAARSGERE